ncbi:MULTISPECIES: carboxylesterase/lipase family protein [Bacillaceae]|uniref:Carboxylic ester hydrolase n=1 Tax=Evansella alkalicola TaxID=745819 RepID=A0ABS6JXR1_9BACI|nr:MULTISPECIES: carboxylesterase/lipase family protein [Bacillaceae]MBU9723022.1 carboxylesterase/lipase family protein [Bacillus alkalicola]
MNPTLVETKYGKVEGMIKDHVCIWKGIPYAQPPIGDLRFQAAKPPMPWSGVRQATQFGPSAYQEKRSNEEEVSEDCLTLNIWAKPPDDTLRPVMVWIHGGGFNFGSGKEDLFHGTSFVTRGDVVVVTFNYRLGPFGFLQLDEFGGEEYGSSGNNGILDQVAALQWINENIEVFGGDPSQVTIFGESAGGRSVSLLLAMPRAQGLFQKAIIQSGALTTFSKSSDATAISEKVLHYLNVNSNELDKLKTIPPQRFLEAVRNLKLGISFAPTIDGELIPDYPMKQFESGFSRDVPVIIGTNRDECNFNLVFEESWKKLKDDEIVDKVSRMVGNYWSEVSPYYLNHHQGGKTMLERLIPAMTFNAFTYSAIEFCNVRERHDAPTWLYRFDWSSPQFEGQLGASHAMEIPFVWNNLDCQSAWRLTGKGEERKLVAEAMHQAWINFAHHSDPSPSPNAKTITKWSPYRSTNMPTMIFDVNSREVENPFGQEHIVWEEAAKSLKTVHRPALII